MESSAENKIRPLVEQLYESEGLTDALTDEAATLLLQWGEEQLNNLAHLQLEQADLDTAAQSLRRAIRAVNHLIEQRAELSDTEMVEALLKLIEQVITITSIAQKSSLKEINHDQET
jgi:ABC-type nitrate/sulfonate/bicarbonate transport system substrate-binding protein